jgi:hypothetical protein
MNQDKNPKRPPTIFGFAALAFFLLLLALPSPAHAADILFIEDCESVGEYGPVIAFNQSEVYYLGIVF